MAQCSRLRPSFSSNLRTLAKVVFLLSSACVKPATSAKSAGNWSYEVLAPAECSRAVAVEAAFDGARTERLAIGKESQPFVRGMEVWRGNGYRAINRRGEDWIEPSCSAHCRVRYHVDLGEVAAG